MLEHDKGYLKAIEIFSTILISIFFISLFLLIAYSYKSRDQIIKDLQVKCKQMRFYNYAAGYCRGRSGKPCVWHDYGIIINLNHPDMLLFEDCPDCIDNSAYNFQQRFHTLAGSGIHRGEEATPIEKSFKNYFDKFKNSRTR